MSLKERGARAARMVSSPGDRRDQPDVSTESVHARAAALTSALESGAGCLPRAGVEQAEAVIAKTAARTSIAGGRTVVALAGATGSGKSSLFNALAGADVAQVGARRPTTAAPTAAVWGSEPSSAILDWLNVGARHLVDENSSKLDVSGSRLVKRPAAQAATQPAKQAQQAQQAQQVQQVSPGGSALELDGLVLIDLPDFDSSALAHRIEADRVLDLVDVFVWVTDPQKYADARLHEDYIAKLSAHDAITVTVLNQADRLAPETLAACADDLLQLLAADGVVHPEVIITSATDGSGLGELRQRISGVVAGRKAAIRRLDSDLRSVATLLRTGVADSEPSLDDFADRTLVDALSRAAGLPVIVSAVELDFRRESLARTGWPLTRWARFLRPAPLRRLGLNKDAPAQRGAISQSDVRAVLGRSSLPPATPSARAAVALATRELGDRAGRELPQAWTDVVADAAMPPGGDLGDALDQAVVGTSLRTRSPLWWDVFGVLQGVLATAAVVGLGWLVVLAVLDWLRLPQVTTPTLGSLPYPSLLFAGGLLVGFVMSLLTRAMGRVGGRRRKRVVAARLHEAVTQVARDRFVAPVRKVLDRHRMTRESLDAALKVQHRR